MGAGSETKERTKPLVPLEATRSTPHTQETQSGCPGQALSKVTLQIRPHWQRTTKGASAQSNRPRCMTSAPCSGKTGIETSSNTDENLGCSGAHAVDAARERREGQWQDGLTATECQLRLQFLDVKFKFESLFQNDRVHPIFPP